MVTAVQFSASTQHHLDRGAPPERLPERAQCGSDRKLRMTRMAAPGGCGKSVPHSPPQLKTPASAQRKRTWAAEGRQAEAERITKRPIGTAPKSLLGATSEKANCDSPPWTTRERWMRLGMS